ncbi:hypothetical protein RJ639_013431 [Escallonia herrerae]|uniref:Uncharacterized protein n=1 Tax=Escallonia herrerae TaxID=1293975 RepID=A0AA89AM42_9ASTE|nr:hypothetical protein RJ639_013431 [Escallonia herrerae]
MEIVESTIILEETEGLNENRGGKGDFAKLKSCLESILRLGVICSAELPRERVDSGNVVKELHRITKAYNEGHTWNTEMLSAEVELTIAFTQYQISLNDVCKLYGEAISMHPQLYIVFRRHAHLAVSMNGNDIIKSPGLQYVDSLAAKPSIAKGISTDEI